MSKTDIYFGGASKENPLFFQKIYPKNTPMPPMSRIGPGLIFFWFLILFISVIYIGK